MIRLGPTDSVLTDCVRSMRHGAYGIGVRDTAHTTLAYGHAIQPRCSIQSHPTTSLARCSMRVVPFCALFHFARCSILRVVPFSHILHVDVVLFSRSRVECAARRVLVRPFALRRQCSFSVVVCASWIGESTKTMVLPLASAYCLWLPLSL